MFLRRLPAIRSVAGMMVRRELVFLAATTPFLMFPNPLTGGAFALVVVTWLARWIDLGYPTRRTRLDAPIALLLVMTVVGMLASVDLSVSWPKFWGIILGVAIYYGLVNTLQSARDIQHMGVFLLGVGVAAALFSLVVTDWQSLQYYDVTWVSSRIPTWDFLVRALPRGGVPRPAELLIHPREVGGTMGLILPLALSLLLFGRGWLIKSGAALAALVLGFTLVLAQALSALAGTAIAIVLLALWRYRWLLWIVPPAVMLGVVLAHGPILSAINPASKVGDSIAVRFVIWLWALEALQQEPLTGVGLNSFDYALGSLLPMALIPGVWHAHNLFVQVALDVGVIGLAAFSWLLVAFGHAIKTGLRSASDPNVRCILAGIAAGMASFIVFATMDTIALGAKPGAAFWAMLGLAAGAEMTNRPPPTTTTSPLRLRWIVLLLMVFVGMASAALFTPSLRGITYLNLGMIQANKALAEARDTRQAPVELMRSARSNLERALTNGQGTVHVYYLLGSINGWLGDCSQSIDYLRRTILLGGVKPFGSDFLVQGAPSLVARGVAIAPEPVGEAVIAMLERVKARSGLPRTTDGLYKLYRYVAIQDVMGTRWGPFSGWWEPYVMLAIIANEHLHDPAAAAEFLHTGLEQANFKAPLSCYRVEKA